MKRILLITSLIIGMTVSYSFAQMGQGHMGQGMMESQTQQQPAGTPSGGGYYPCPMGSGGYGMMGQGMMGNRGCGMMGPGMMGHMGGMMGRGMMGSGGCGMMGHMGGMKGRGMMGSGMYGTGDYDPEAYQKFMNDTAGLRKKLHDKKFEYFEAVRIPDAKRETIMKLEKDIFDLKWEIYEKSPQ